MSKFEQRAARLRREMAERVPPLRLGPVGPPAPPVSPAERVAVLEQARHQLLFGLPGETGPFPSRAIPECVADLRRRQALGDPTFTQLEAQLAADPAAGPRLFGDETWREVGHVFGLLPARRPKKRAPLESTDLGAWKRARWAEFLASDAGKAAIESGRLVPASASANEAPTKTPDEANTP